MHRLLVVSEQYGPPRLEGDQVQVGVHAGDGRPEVLLLLPLRHPHHRYHLRHRHRHPLPHRAGGGLRRVQGNKISYYLMNLGCQ